MMDDYGSITIDNKNLLDDLLGLGGAGDIVGAGDNDVDGLGGLTSTNPLLNTNDDDAATEYFFSKRRNSLNQVNNSKFGSKFNLNSAATNGGTTGGAGSNYLQPVQVNRFYLESPTFTKAEDDIYSRLSNADLATNREQISGTGGNGGGGGGGGGESTTHHLNNNNNNNNNDIDLHDSLSGDTGGGGVGGGVLTNTVSNSSSNTSSSSKPISANFNQNHHPLHPHHHQNPAPPPPPPIQHRIGSNRLLSDLAVASLPPHANIIKRDPLIYSNTANTTTNNQIRLSKPSLEDPLLFGDSSSNNPTQDLLDSLELTNNNPVATTNTRYNAPPLLLNQRRLSPHQPSILDNQYNLQQAQQQQQQQQQQLQQQQSFHLPLQTIPTQGGIAFVLPSPTGAAAPAQFIPVPVQIAPAPLPAAPTPSALQQSAATMYYHHTGDPSAALHPHQQPPMFYNTAYPINIPYSNQNVAASYYAAPPPGGGDFYQQQQQQQPGYNNQNQQPSNKHAQQGPTMRAPPQQQMNNNPYENGGYNNNNINNGHFNANPLQPPIPTPRNVKQQQQQQGHQNKQYYDNGNFDDLDENDLNNEFNNLSVYDRNNNAAPVHHNNKPSHNNNNNNNNIEEDDDTKGQQVWQNLQKKAATKNSGGSKKQRAAGFGSSNSNHSLNGNNSNNNNRLNNGGNSNSNGAISKKPPLPGKPDHNYLEKNIEAIRNKENLTHRYPEKKYEIVHSNKFSKNAQGGTPTKKPPHHLQPLENNYDEDGGEGGEGGAKGFDPYETKKISIPLDTKNLKDKDHINVDINLRLIDFLPQQQQQHNRSMDDFSDDPLARYIKHYETNMSRSLPGSSGSFNSMNGKNRQPLPPLGQHGGGVGAGSGASSKFYPAKPYSHEESRRALLQHEYESEIKSEDGYLAQLQKSHMKRPPIKTYTIKDYRNFKKDAPTNTNSNTGKLGFDYDNEYYKQKLNKAQKQIDYAERVKARNKIILADQQRQNEENGSIRSQQQSPPSKTQRAKDYVNTTVFRVRSASLQPSPKQQQQAAKKRSSDSTEPNVVRRRDSLDGNTPTTNAKNNGRQIDLNPRYQKGTATAQPTDNTAMVRIRDPVTSKVRTIYLSDTQIEELAVRHQMEKSKVSTIQINSNSGQQQQQQQQSSTRQEAPQPQPTIITNNSSRNLGLLKKGRQPLNLSSSRDLLARDEEFTTSPSNNESPAAAATSHRRATTINEQEDDDNDNDGDDYRRQYINNSPPLQQQQHKTVGNEVDHLIERHLSEKKKVNEFQTASNIDAQDSLEYNNNNHSVEVE